MNALKVLKALFVCAVVAAPVAEASAHFIAGCVWYDTDCDGIIDPDDFLFIGVRVDLCDADGNPLATTVTDDRGAYSFATGQLPGPVFTVKVQDVSGFDLGHITCENSPSSVCGTIDLAQGASPST